MWRVSRPLLSTLIRRSSSPPTVPPPPWAAPGGGAWEPARGSARRDAPHHRPGPPAGARSRGPGSGPPSARAGPPPPGSGRPRSRAEAWGTAAGRRARADAVNQAPRRATANRVRADRSKTPSHPSRLSRAAHGPSSIVPTDVATSLSSPPRRVTLRILRFITAIRPADGSVGSVRAPGGGAERGADPPTEPEPPAPSEPDGPRRPKPILRKFLNPLGLGRLIRASPPRRADPSPRAKRTRASAVVRPRATPCGSGRSSRADTRRRPNPTTPRRPNPSVQVSSAVVRLRAASDPGSGSPASDRPATGLSKNTLHHRRWRPVRSPNPPRGAGPPSRPGRPGAGKAGPQTDPRPADAGPTGDAAPIGSDVRSGTIRVFSRPWVCELARIEDATGPGPRRGG